MEIFGMLVLCLIIYKAGNWLRKINQRHTGPYAHVSTSELKQRYAALQRLGPIMTDDQLKEYGSIQHVLKMREEEENIRKWLP